VAAIQAEALRFVVVADVTSADVFRDQGLAGEGALRRVAMADVLRGRGGVPRREDLVAVRLDREAEPAAVVVAASPVDGERVGKPAAASRPSSHAG
jgi:hypothetical protein